MVCIGKIISNLKLLVVIFSCLIVFTIVHADSERVTDFKYDAAGNLIDITSASNVSAPNIVNLSPTFINRGRTVGYTATGTSLIGLTINSPDAGLLISNVVSTDINVSFSITALDSAALGNAVINFTTGLGTDSESLVVAGRVPNIITEPSPISVPSNSQPTQIKLLFEQPSQNAETYNLTIQDTSIVTVSPLLLSVLPGATEATIDITGLVTGTTELVLESPTDFISISYPVYSAQSFSGTGETFSTPIDIIVGSDDPTGAVNNPILSPAVGLAVGSDDPAGGVINPVLSSAVGITVGGDDPSGGVSNPVLSLSAGVIVGPLLESIMPMVLDADTSESFTITGSNLENVDSVVIDPATDLIVSAITINPEGTEITFSIDADAAIQLGVRDIIVSTIAGEVGTQMGLPLTLDIQ